jgi:hypothetical protein
MKRLSREEVYKALQTDQPLFLVDEVEEVAYDFTKYPKLRVKSKGGKIIERMEAYTASETNAWVGCLTLTAEEFEKY